MNQDNNIIQLIDVKKEFPKIVAVNNVSLCIKSNETLGLVGESGCGKTTLGKCILKLLKIDSGKIIYRGNPIHNLPEASFRPYRKRIQMLFQNPLTSFDPFYSIQTSINEFCNLNDDLKEKGEIIKKIKYEMNRVGLSQRILTSKPNELSGGQLQRAALVRTLIVEPELVVLDEPTSSLDMSIRGQIMNLLQDIQEQLKVSYLIISHDLRVIKTIAHRVLVMYLGEIVEETTTKKLFNKPFHPYTRALLEAALLNINENETKDILKGEVTQTSRNLIGCKLATRCQYSKEICFQKKQELKEIEKDHFVRCWRAKDF